MMTEQGDLALLNDPIAQELLQSRIPARLAYIWPDGTPRVIPIWFHWNGREIVFGTPEHAPKVHALAQNPHAAVTIDTEPFPSKVLMIRGTARVEVTHGTMIPEYAAAAERYFGVEGGRNWVAQVNQMTFNMARITITPTWVGILDFVQRYPSALEEAMAGSSGGAD
jgi:hypothetical protein